MFDEKVLYPAQFPVQEKNRKSTDVCCTILSAIFALVMFIVACLMWNKNNFENNFFNFNTNSKGVACQNGQSLYYSSPNQYDQSTCVNSCPNKFTSRKGLCIPDDENLQSQYLSNPSVAGPFNYKDFKNTLGWSALTAFGIGLLWMVISLCFPKNAPALAHVLGAITLIVLGVLSLILWDKFWSNNNGLKIFFAILCFLLAIILIAMLCCWSNQRRFQGIILDYGKRFLIERPNSFLYIPVFMLLGLGLFALTVWQHCCFSSAQHSDNNFFNFNNSGFWSILNIFQFIWGLGFLRDAFNFCVSGNAVDWYWWRPKVTNCYTPYQRLACKHWGSVVGGSFLNSFFTIPTLIIELLVCHPQTCCSGLGTFCYNSCSCCTCFFDLVRTDAYSYINLSGIPFCNAARQTKKINERNPAYIGSHSPMSHYRFAAHAFLIPVTLLACWFILRARVWTPNLWHWIVLIVVIYAVLHWFINILADAAEGLQTSYLVERELENGNFKFMQRLLPSFRTPLEHIERRLHGEGDGFC